MLGMHQWESFKYLSGKPVDGGYELLYEYKHSKSIRKRIKLPEISLPSGSKVDYIEYSVRDSDKSGVNATLRRILQFNDVSFEIEEYARYEGDSGWRSIVTSCYTAHPGFW